MFELELSPRRLRQLTMALTGIAALGITLCACRQEADNEFQSVGSHGVRSPLASASPQSPPPALAPLDDPANPYSGEYEAWDQWAASHLDLAFGDRKPPLAPEGFAASNPGLRWVSLRVRVDSAGRLVPYRRSVAAFAAATAGALPEDSTLQCPFYSVSGPMPADLAEAQDFATYEAIGAYFPAVSDWLIDYPPLGAWLIPNGEFITRGKLGAVPASGGSGNPCSAQPSKDPAQPVEKLTSCCDLYRYDPSGKLIEEFNGAWWSPYFAPCAGTDCPHSMRELPGGLLEVTDPESGLVVGTYDYNGSPLPAGTSHLEGRNGHFGTWQSGPFLRNIGLAQRRLSKEHGS